MERHFDAELNELRKKLSDMASIVEGMIDTSVKALLERSPEILESVFSSEKEVNKIHIEVDEYCLKLIALHQPTAADLRLITSAMKVNSELERIGDQAINISQNTRNLVSQAFFVRVSIIPRMTELTKLMVKDSINAFITKDSDLAKAVLLRDEQVDNLKQEFFKETIKHISENPAQTEYFIDLMLISRNLEKIADHTTNIAEDVIFMVLGKDIRHHNIDDHRS